MTSWVIADSGIFIATVMEEKFSKQADALVEYWSKQSLQVAAPYLFQYEAVAVVRKHTHRKTITPEKGIIIRDRLLSQPVTLFTSDALLRRAYEFATQFNQPTAYDSQYLAVAEHLGGEFWTLDQRLFNTVHNKLPWVKWAGNFTTTNDNN